MYKHMLVQACVCVCVQTLICASMCLSTCTTTLTCASMCLCMCTNTYLHKHVLVHVRTCVYICIQTWNKQRQSLVSSNGLQTHSYMQGCKCVPVCRSCQSVCTLHSLETQVVLTNTCYPLYNK